MAIRRFREFFQLRARAPARWRTQGQPGGEVTFSKLIDEVSGFKGPLEAFYQASPLPKLHHRPNSMFLRRLDRVVV